MLFRRNKAIEVSEILRDRSPDQSYWAMVRRQFRKNRLAVWAVRVLAVLVFIAMFGDFLANEKPLYCKIEGKTYFPVCKQYLVDLGWSKWGATFVNKDWSDQNYESVVYPLIPYSATTLDLKNTSKGPGDDQRVKSSRFHHWLGTDDIGRDIAAGMIRGTRIALLIGFISMGVATFIGLFLGGLAGFFGDDKLFVSWAQLILNSIGLLLGIFYGFIARSHAISENGFLGGFGLGVLIFILIVVSMNALALAWNRVFPSNKKIALPIDILVMRLIEIMNSIPSLIFILALLAVIEKGSIFNVMIIIGLISWTGIARFVRAELLRVRSLDYIEAARSLGISDLRILLRHAIPNTLTPVLITIAFGVAGAILTEAALSFLGIGIPVEEVTWGRILNAARSSINSWWLAIFPGIAIFITVIIFNLLGEGLTSALNPHEEQ